MSTINNSSLKNRDDEKVFPKTTFDNVFDKLSGFSLDTKLRGFELALTALTNSYPVRNFYSSSYATAGGGYIKYGNGLIIQWGNVGRSSQDEDGDLLVKFPISFSNKGSYTVVTCSQNIDPQLGSDKTDSVIILEKPVANGNSLTESQITLRKYRITSSGVTKIISGGINWIAIGF